MKFLTTLLLGVILTSSLTGCCWHRYGCGYRGLRGGCATGACGGGCATGACGAGAPAFGAPTYGAPPASTYTVPDGAFMGPSGGTVQLGTPSAGPITASPVGYQYSPGYTSTALAPVDPLPTF